MESRNKQLRRRMSNSDDWHPRYISQFRHDPLWLYRYLPQAYVLTSNPVYIFVVRSLPQSLNSGVDADSMVDYILTYVRWIGGGVLVCGLLIGSISADVVATLQAIFISLVILTLAYRILIDFSVMLGTLATTERDIRGTQNELIQLTGVSTHELIRAHFTVAQIRVWRVIVMDTGLRIGTVLLGILTLVLWILIELPDTTYASRIHQMITYGEITWVHLIVDIVFLCLSIGIAAYVYILETRWRLNLLTAAAIAINSDADFSAGMRPLVGFMAILLTWVVQVMFVFIPFAIILGIVSFYEAAETVGHGLGLFGVVALASSGTALHRMYRYLTTAWLNAACHQLEKRWDR